MFGIINLLRRKLKIILVGTVLAASVGTAGYQTGVIGNKNQKKVDSFIVRRGDLKEELTLSGELEAEEKAVLRFQTSGRLAWVGAKEGDYVKKYQVLATLDQKELKKKLEKELIDYKNERWDFDQQADDYDGVGMTPEIQRILEKGQFDLDNVVLDVEIQNIAVELSRLYTPIAGLLIRIDTPNAGVNITPASAEFEVINPDSLYLSVTADQTEVIKLKSGMTGKMMLDSYIDDEFDGEIDKIAFTPETGETGTVYKVNFKFPLENTDYKYRVGMTGDVTFVTKEKNNVLYLPLKYVKGAKTPKVTVIKDNKKIQKKVKTGIETDEYIEIVSGLSQGEVVYD